MAKHRKFHPTPDMMAACYDMLLCTPPFNRWNLPRSEQVEFYIELNPARYGAYEVDRTRIWISSLCKDTPTFVQVMAHEMVHLRQCIKGKRSATEWHGRDFKTMALQVCHFHGWLPAHF